MTQHLNDVSYVLGTILCPEFISSVLTIPHKGRPQSYPHFPRCFQDRADVIREARESETPGTRAYLPGLPSWCNNRFSPSSPAPSPNFPHLQNWVPDFFFLANKRLSTKAVSKIPSQPQLRGPGILGGEAGLQIAGSKAAWEVPAVALPGSDTWHLAPCIPWPDFRPRCGLSQGASPGPRDMVGGHELLLPDTSEW